MKKAPRRTAIGTLRERVPTGLTVVVAPCTNVLFRRGICSWLAASVTRTELERFDPKSADRGSVGTALSSALATTIGWQKQRSRTGFADHDLDLKL